MSKGSNFWGTARGRLGNMVISSVKGQQIERKYQPNVANPKTFAQMRQRAVFASAVKFFKHSQQNLFKFAYEDKGQRESDYNAFMRHNVQFFTPVNKFASDNPTLPALGFNLALQLSVGSLPAAETGYFDMASAAARFGLYCHANIDKTEDEKFTWGNVSKAIIKGYGLSNGDIITFVVINTNMTYETFDETIIKGIDAAEPAAGAVWTITQMRIDIDSTEDVTSNVAFDNYYVIHDGIVSAPRQNLYFGSVIFSRNIQWQKLMVSTGTINCSQKDGYLNALAARDSIKEKAVLESWGANPEAILQGALL